MWVCLLGVLCVGVSAGSVVCGCVCWECGVGVCGYSTLQLSPTACIHGVIMEWITIKHFNLAGNSTTHTKPSKVEQEGSWFY